jgi:hypothetical protein
MKGCQVDEFDALINAMGEWTVGRLRDLGLVSLLIHGDPHVGQARMVVQLEKDTWEIRRKAVEALVEIRTLYMDEIAVEFSFTDREPALGRAQTRTYQYA